MKSMLRLSVSIVLISMSLSAAAQSFQESLNQADRIRTVDRPQFDSILARLDQSKDEATPSQRMQLRLLHAYQPLLAGDYQASIHQLQSLLADKPDVDLQYRAGSMLANNYTLARQFSDGLEILQRTLLMSDRVNDANTRQQGYLVAAVLYNQVGQYRLGLRYADRVLVDPITPRNKCIATGMRIESLVRLDSPPPDEDIAAGIQQCRALAEEIPAGLLVTYQARKWFAQGRLEDAAALLKRNISAIEATHYPRAIGEIHSMLSEVLFKLGDIPGAEASAKAAVAQRIGIANTPPLTAAFQVLYKIAESRKNFPEALAYYKKFSEADKGYLNEVKTRELAYQIVRNENEQKGQQIELLNRRNSVLQLQQQVDQTSAQNSRLLMLVMGLLAALIGYWAYKTKRMHSSLRRMAETDALTGLCNRHYFTVQSEKSLARCALAGEPAALVMFDLDHFKAINDSYGHTTGDWVLRRVADTCKQFCRRIDHLGRIGGEEFAILLHGCDLHVATRLAEDCRVRLAGIDTHESGYQFTVTGSFGVSASSLSGYDLAKLLAHADLMLYRAKREGRNRVRTYAPEMPITLRPQATLPLEGEGALGEGIVSGAPSANPLS